MSDPDSQFWLHTDRKCFSGKQPSVRAYAYVEKKGVRLPLWTRSCKQYIVCGLARFAAEYERTPVHKRHYFEIIPENVPVKLFLDIDGDFIPNMDDYAVFETSLKNCVRELVGEKFEIMTNAEPYVLDATTDKKFSRHYIFPIVFASIHVVGNFVNELKMRLADNELSKFIDMSIYTKNRNFRLIGSAKEGKTNFLKLISHQDQKWQLSVQLIRTMVTTIREEDQVVATPLFPHALMSSFVCGDKDDSPGSYRSSRVTSASVPEHFKDTCDKITEFVLKKHGAQAQYQTFMYLGSLPLLQWTLVPGAKCPKNDNKVHKSNRTWLCVDLRDNKLFYKCCDKQCDYCIFGIKDIKHLVCQPKQDETLMIVPRKKARLNSMKC